MKLGWFLGGVAIIGSFAFSDEVMAAPKKWDLSPAEIQKIQQHQHSLGLRLFSRHEIPARPFSELEQAGYLFMSGEFDFDSRSAKQTMAGNLPDGVTLVLFVSPGMTRESVLRNFQDVIVPERVRVVEIQDTDRGFWARDGLPVPVWSASAGKLDLVDARYYHGFEPDELLAGLFHSLLLRHDYYFEGGNFMANDRGDCVTVDNDTSAGIPEAVFQDYYGCKRTVRLPFEKGIGHVDESARFLSSNTLVTDSARYEAILREQGFTVIRLPRPKRRYETYVNSLLVNGTVFVPIFREGKDNEALSVYRGQGLNVVGIPTRTLSNEGLGSLHCITMTYPKVPFQSLLDLMGGRELK
jgi:hypothetical protein